MTAEEDRTAVVNEPNDNRPPATRRRMVIAGAACLITLGALSLLAAAPETVCETVTPTDAPNRTISGSWGGEDGESLVLLDPSQRSIMAYAGDGKRLVSPQSSLADGLRRLSPLEAWPLQDGGMIVEGVGTFLTRVSPGLDRLSPPYDVATESGVHDIFPYRWGLTDDSLERGGIVMCGEVQRQEGGDWSAGVFYIPLTGENRQPIELAGFERVDLRRLGCRLGGQIVGSVHGTAYLLLLEETPEIFRVDLDGEQPLTPVRLHPRPEAMKARPNLPHLVWRENYGALMKEVTRASMPVELVGWGDHLYLLLREPAPAGGTRWSVAKIDPEAESGENVVVAELPSDAAHISMIPGPRRWAFVEKAPPESLEDQTVIGFKMVQASRLQTLEGSALCP